MQAPAPDRLIEGGLPTDATVAQVLVSKYADHLPLYRQSQIYARQGIDLDRSTLADWVGRAAFTLRPVHERLLTALKASPKLFADETTAPVCQSARKFARRITCGRVFAQTRPKLAAFTHVVQLASIAVQPPTLNELTAEVRRTYQGPLEIDEDLMSFEIGETVTVKRLMPRL
jgi:Transposase IS66 family